MIDKEALEDKVFGLREKCIEKQKRDKESNKIKWYSTPELKGKKWEIIEYLSSTKRKGIGEVIDFLTKGERYFKTNRKDIAWSEHALSVLELFDTIISDNDLLIEDVPHDSIVIMSLLYKISPTILKSLGMELTILEEEIIGLSSVHKSILGHSIQHIFESCESIIRTNESIEEDYNNKA